eukprot:760403-Hanusia_phi.AAC.8
MLKLSPPPPSETKSLSGAGLSETWQVCAGGDVETQAASRAEVAEPSSSNAHHRRGCEQNPSMVRGEEIRQLVPTTHLHK